jgi:PBP1b-binding outer membrane lipoprotein LpoB
MKTTRILAAAVAALLLLSGCSTVRNSDGTQRKVLTPLKYVPDGDYEVLAVTVAGKLTNNKVTSDEGGATIKDGRLVAGGVRAIHTNIWGTLIEIWVRKREPGDS